MNSLDFLPKTFLILYPCLENSTTGNAITRTKSDKSSLISCQKDFSQVQKVLDQPKIVLDLKKDSCSEKWQNAYQNISGQIFSRVDAPILRHKLFTSDFFLDIWIVQCSIEHYNGEWQKVASVSFIEKIWILTTVVLGKCFHDAIDLHGFTRQSKKQVKKNSQNYA